MNNNHLHYSLSQLSVANGSYANTDRSRMNRIRSLAKRFKLDKQENPNKASVKKNRPKYAVSSQY